MQIMHISLIFT